jgi:hypothetical protein
VHDPTREIGKTGNGGGSEKLPERGYVSPAVIELTAKAWHNIGEWLDEFDSLLVWLEGTSRELFG